MPIDSTPQSFDTVGDELLWFMKIVGNDDGPALARSLHLLVTDQKSERVLEWALTCRHFDLICVLLEGCRTTAARDAQGFCRPREPTIRRILEEAAYDVGPPIDPRAAPLLDRDTIDAHRAVGVLAAHCDGGLAVHNMLKNRTLSGNRAVEVVGAALSDATVRSLRLSPDDCQRVPRLARRWWMLRDHDILTAVVAGDTPPRRHEHNAGARRM